MPPPHPKLPSPSPPSSPPATDPGDAPRHRHRPHPSHPGLGLCRGQVPPCRERWGGTRHPRGAGMGQATPVPRAILSPHHPQRAMALSPPFPLAAKTTSRPSPPHAALGRDESLAATVAVFSPLSSPCRGCPGGCRLSRSSRGAWPAWQALGTAPLPAKPRRAATAPSTPRRAAATPAREGKKPAGSKQAQATAPGSHAQRARAWGNKKKAPKKSYSLLRDSQAASWAPAAGLCSAPARWRRWARGGFTPCAGTERTAGGKGSAELPGKGEFLAGAAASAEEGG